MPSGFGLFRTNLWNLVSTVLNRLHGQPSTYDKKYVSLQVGTLPSNNRASRAAYKMGRTLVIPATSALESAPYR